MTVTALAASLALITFTNLLSGPPSRPPADWQRSTGVFSSDEYTPYHAGQEMDFTGELEIVATD